jgi:hypothetical protein
MWRRAATIVATIALSPITASLADTEWPMSLKRFGGGYPQQGNPCSKVRETAATAEFLDDSAILIACPASRSSVLVRRFVDTSGGRIVGEVEGFALISVPRAPRDASGGATFKGTPFHATGRIPCAQHAAQAMTRCNYGVIRKRGGAAIVKITWPDGRGRVIFFANGRVTGADTSQADGSAKHRVVAIKELDGFMVRVGEERYEIPDAVVQGN